MKSSKLKFRNDSRRFYPKRTQRINASIEVAKAICADHFVDGIGIADGDGRAASVLIRMERTIGRLDRPGSEGLNASVGPLSKTPL